VNRTAGWRAVCRDHLTSFARMILVLGLQLPALWRAGIWIATTEVKRS
jgi:hypothetical protein